MKEGQLYFNLGTRQVERVVDIGKTSSGKALVGTSRHKSSVEYYHQRNFILASNTLVDAYLEEASILNK